ncbi:MAG: hypothetical protein M1816_002331 [Peltula sp. TS41687]|nr:MAG: hypothetical protein M1816_002331 [Peltula sp. TS41687]
MASHAQPSPPTGLHPHHAPPPPPSAAVVHAAQVNGQMAPGLQAQAPKTPAQHLASINEAVWLQIGNLTDLIGDLDGALQAYEQALRHNKWSVPAMIAISSILRNKEQFPKAVEYLQNILKIDATNGEVWGSLGHCYLMMDDLQQAYSAYQQALYHLRDPKEPKLWYGIGILYDRYGSLDLAEEAFSQVMRMQPDFEKANEIYFRLGIIYKQQTKYQESLECFKYIINDPPRPLTQEDIWFQIGHVHEQQKDYDSAKNAYRRVLDRDPNHAKVLQQLGWLHHQQSSSFSSQEQAIDYLEKSVNSDNTDAQSWYLLGRCYMSQQKYPKAYEAYQQAVYRDGRNPTFWCSIGVLYYQINQYRDALDAYSRAIRLNPYISEVWYDLGTLYESCNNQINDALDAYNRAAELDPTNVHIKARLQLLRSGRATGMPNQNSAPLPQDVHPQAYQAPGVGGPPRPQWGNPPGPTPPVQAPPPHPSSTNGEWGQRLAEIQHPPPLTAGPPPPNPYGEKDAIRPPPPRQPSPRQEQLRHYERPAPSRRPMSPSPRVTHAAPGPYPPPSGLPQHGPLPHPPASQPPPSRIPNPNYGAPTPNILPPANLGPSNAGPPGPGPMPPYSRNSPPPEVRPLVEDKVSSPTSGHPHQGYQHQPGGIAGGAPPPEAALVAAEAAARDRNDRTPSVKRMREWSDENGSVKKIASDENRVRVDDHHHRRPSPSNNQLTSPQDLHGRSPSEARRADDQRRPDEGYHPPEGPHRPPSLPSMNHGPYPPMSQGPPPPKEEQRRDDHEPAARKVDVDEDYDDDAEDDKRHVMSAGRQGPERTSPSSANGMHGGNNIMNGMNKAEA